MDRLADETVAEERAATGDTGGSWIGFLVAAFCIVGLTGLFATYAAPLPYQRAMRREIVLDQVLASPDARDAERRAALGDSAGPVLDGHGPLAERVAAERVAMRARFSTEADAAEGRLRMLIVVVTVLGAGVGSVMLALQRRG